jgi:hypothetical protein
MTKLKKRYSHFVFDLLFLSLLASFLPDDEVVREISAVPIPRSICSDTLTWGLLFTLTIRMKEVYWEV